MAAETDVIIIGAGAAGMAAAIEAAECGDRVLLLEAGDRPGRKLSATGNGRCNLMNRGELRYYGAEEFARAVLRRCGLREQTDFWKHLGLFLTEESEGRIYPRTLQAASVVNALKTGLETNRIPVRLRTRVTGIRKTGDGFILKVEDREAGACEIRGSRVVVACGGAAHPKLGGSESGYTLLKALGHPMIPIRPALTALETDRKAVSGLSGIRVRGRVSVRKGTSVLQTERGEILFTDGGVSGICVMQCSGRAEPGKTELELNLADGLFANPEEALAELRGRRERFGTREAQTILEGIVVPKLSYAVCKQAGLPLRGETMGQLREEELRRVAETLLCYRIPVTGKRGMDDAQVTAGGADCAAFSPETLESRLVPGLYAAGEVLNVDGDCGGYNLMFAFGSGILAGQRGRRNPVCGRET